MQWVAKQASRALTFKVQPAQAIEIREIRQLAQHEDAIILEAVCLLAGGYGVSPRRLLHRANLLSSAQEGPTFGNPEDDPQKKQRKVSPDNRYGAVRQSSSGPADTTPASRARSTYNAQIRLRGGDFR